jgi:catechol 2,3-dioxygenase-like lactoylglutathione lyase family enzyme
MQTRGIAWAGTRTDRWSETVEMFERHLGMRRRDDHPGIAVFTLENGDTIEVFTTDEPEHGHFTTGPVVGFAVDDIDAARAELDAAGIEVLGPVQRGGGLAWLHFRGADGNVWELTQRET